MADAFTSDTYDALCQEAEGYLARGLAEQARELLLKAASLIGTRPKARSLLADACMSLGLWEEARSQLETLTTLEIDNYHNHFRLGQVLEELGENQLARDNYNVVLDHNSDHHGARVAISRLENTDETADVNLASFFASGGSGTENQDVLEAGELDSVDSGEVVESVFGSTQVFPDAQTDDVFAGEEDVEKGVDKLLKDLGVEGDTQETSGAVSELLDSLGIKPEGEEEEGEPIQKVDISTLLVAEDEVQPAAAAVEEKAGSELADEDETAVLESVFANEPASDEEASPEVEPEAAVAADVSEEVVLETVFSAETEASEVTEPAADAEGPADEEPVAPAAATEDAVPEAPPEKKDVGMLESIFGAPAKAEATEEVKPATEVTVPETPTEEPEIPEPADQVEETEVTEPAAEAEGPAETEPEPVVAETEVTEPATEAEESEVTESATEAEGPEEAKPEAPEAGKAVFIVHRPDPESLVTVELMSGTVAVRQAYIIARSSTLTLDEDDEGRRLVTGKGSIWLGQGERVPVTISLSEGMYARNDRMVLYDAGIHLEPVELQGVHALVKLQGSESSEVLFFTSGRMRELDLSARTSVQVKPASLLAADKDVEISCESGSEDFLTLSGSGRIFISG